MKSIKEQAKELEIEVYRTTRSKDVAERCKWSYIKGAKYVLNLLTEEDDKYDTVMECYPALTKIIRELMK